MKTKNQKETTNSISNKQVNGRMTLITTAIVLSIALVSCKKNDTTDTRHLSAEITVYSTNSWTTESPTLSTVPGAVVSFYTDEVSFASGVPDYTFTTDKNGKAMCYDLTGSTVYFVVEKDNERNIHTVAGGDFLIAGVFQSQSEIDISALQADASVGGTRYTDINDDGIINHEDRTTYDYIVLTNGKTVVKDVVIGN